MTLVSVGEDWCRWNDGLPVGFLSSVRLLQSAWHRGARSAWPLQPADGAVPRSQVYTAEEQSVQIPTAGPKDKISVQARDRYYNSSWSEWSSLCR